jgi:hypothetical protein
MATQTQRKTASTNGRKTRTRNVTGAQSQQSFSLAEVAAIAASSAVSAIMSAHPNAVMTESAGSGQSDTRQPSGRSDSGSATSSTRTRSNSNATTAGTSGDSKPGRKPDPKSGLSRARVQFAKMKGAERSAVVSSFINDLGLKKGVANAYFHLIENSNEETAHGRGRAARGGRRSSKVANKAAAA